MGIHGYNGVYMGMKGIHGYKRVYMGIKGYTWVLRGIHGY